MASAGNDLAPGGILQHIETYAFYIDLVGHVDAFADLSDRQLRIRPGLALGPVC